MSDCSHGTYTYDFGGRQRVMKKTLDNFSDSM